MEKPKKPPEIESPYFPSDIQQEIVTWLPAKSVFMLQATCKLWKSWMHDPTFAKKHFDHGGRRYKCIIYFLYFNQEGVFRMETVDGSMQPHHKLLIDLQSLSEPMRFNYTISDSCNGIVCIYNSNCDSNIVLYNPLTKESVLLPEPSTLNADDNNRSRYQTVHVGFVPSKDEYKIVRIFSDNRSQFFGHCVVFSLSSWSWKKISGITIPISVSPILANGVMFWLRYANTSVSWFDLATEQSGIIVFPPHMPVRIISLSEVEGSLACLFWHNKNYMSIWKLQDIARGVWTRCAPICNPKYVPVPVSDSCFRYDCILYWGRASFIFEDKFCINVSILGDSQVVYYFNGDDKSFDRDAKRRMSVRLQPSLHLHSLLSLKKFVPTNCSNC